MLHRIPDHVSNGESLRVPTKM